MTNSNGNNVNSVGSQRRFKLKCVILQLVKIKLYLKLISRNKRSGDWLNNLIGRNKRSGNWLRENCNFDLLLAAARARSTYFAKKLKKVGMTHENKK